MGYLHRNLHNVFIPSFNKYLWISSKMLEYINELSLTPRSLVEKTENLKINK